MVICYITEPSGSICRVTVERGARGEDCFVSVCEQLRLVEKHFFGLQFVSKHGLVMWLNERNPICLQLPAKEPYRMKLRVRFFVDPKLLCTDKARDLFFDQLYDDILRGTRFRFDPADDTSGDMSKAVYLSGLLAQMEHGNISEIDHIGYRQYFPGLKQETIRQEHRRNVGLSRAEAQMTFLDEVASWQYYTMQVIDNLFQVRPSSSDRSVSLGITDNTVVLFDAQKRTLLSFPVGAVRETSYCDNFFKVKYSLDSQNSENLEKIKLRACTWTRRGHMSLHRLFWEMQEFYSSDRVRCDLLTRRHRNMRGDLLSLLGFKRRAKFYRIYTFSLPTTLNLATMMWTKQEEHDKAKSATEEKNTIKSNGRSWKSNDLKAILSYVQDVEPSITSTDDKDVQEAWVNLSNVCNSVSCIICLQRPRSVRYACGHVFCCAHCTVRITSCAVCRAQTSSKSRVYMFTPLVSDLAETAKK
ncbi:E3 ubiquitin-protein ligase MYLIP-like [Corticium candelabrum]|uniref:E3 ubiquitin-protein ligase MYLIP-like n=1 Tax=Corticium candelabrum TaxID=121492 RepID=UPI002E2640BF|nr:E3 ubiquitin-protein ligase MYLIP-like [Corticium candelabrum]